METRVADDPEMPGIKSALVGSTIFWLSSVLHYLGVEGIGAGDNLAGVLASIPVILFAVVGLVGSLTYLLYWPIKYRRSPGQRAIFVYLSGLLLGMVLWQLLLMDQMVPYLETLGTVTAGALIALVVDAGLHRN